MPCDNNLHTHIWADEGELTIERCEKYCGFCGKWFKHAWFVRRHVKDVHKKQFPLLTVTEGWLSSPEGNSKPHTPKKKPRSRSSSTSKKIKRNSSQESAQRIPPPPAFTQNIVAENMFAGVTVPAATDPFLYNHTLDMETLFAVPSIEPGVVSDFVTPQHVRTTGEIIEGVMPHMAHHGAAEALAQGLNTIVGSVVASGKMTEPEVVYVLETFTDTFKVGIVMPMEF